MTQVKHALVVLLVFAMCLVGVAASAHLTGKKICVDPGHGGSDPGAVGQGLQEKAINLDIGLRARSLMQLDAATVVMTRTTDVYVTLQGRCDIANNAAADRFECTHCNAYDGTANGTETFCYSGGSGNSYDLRNKINPEMVSHMGTYNRGLKTEDFYVLIHTNMPAILCEVAFIDNAGDAAKLGNATYRQEAARAYLHGTQSHYGVAPHDPASDIIIDNTSGSFSCSGNWSTGTMSTDKYGTDYRWRSTAAVTDPATWTPNITAEGTWAVYAWWAQGANRSTTAPYQVTHSGGTATVNKNQQSGGGQWNLLGTYTFGLGTGYPTKLSCNTTLGYVVVADAIKWVKQ